MRPEAARRRKTQSGRMSGITRRGGRRKGLSLWADRCSSCNPSCRSLPMKASRSLKSNVNREHCQDFCPFRGPLTLPGAPDRLTEMPIHLIIDGYNLLGARGGLHGDVETRREALIRELVGYRQRKGLPVTVVFDGWRSGASTQQAEWREGIEVVYSRKGEQADAVVKRLAEKYGSDCAVVSSDHEVGNAARAQGSTVMTAGEFETKLQMSG